MRIGGGVRIGGGARIGGTSGSDAVRVSNALIRNHLIVRGRGRNDVIIVDSSMFHDNVTLPGDTCNRMIGRSETAVGGNSDVRGQDGRDTASLNNVSVGGRQKVRRVAFDRSAIDDAFRDIQQQTADELLALRQPLILLEQL